MLDELLLCRVLPFARSNTIVKFVSEPVSEKVASSLTADAPADKLNPEAELIKSSTGVATVLGATSVTPIDQLETVELDAVFPLIETRTLVVEIPRFDIATVCLKQYPAGLLLFVLSVCVNTVYHAGGVLFVAPNPIS